MDTRFIEMDPSEVKRHFSRFYGQQARFFELVHKGQPIGFVGIRPLGQMDGPGGGLEDCERACELEVFVFQEHRKGLRKGVVLAVLDLPKSLSFKRCWMRTSHKSVLKLLRAMEKFNKYGITYWRTILDKHVFVKEFT